MALRLATKINRHIIQTFTRRPLSVGPPTTEVQVEKSQNAEDHEAAIIAENNNSKAYQVCRPRSSSLDRSMVIGKLTDNDTDLVKETANKRHLQPSHLPEYFRSKNEFAQATCKNVEDTIESSSKAARTYKEFSASKTFTNVTLPLKGVKLAKPFPDPVKIMVSHTISDKEKAQQMFCESRTPMKITEKRRMPQVQQQQPSRKFSTKKKCPGKDDEASGGGGAGGKCKKLPMDNCEATATICCKRIPVYKPCEKKEAPYPSFSETCYEEFYEKPSECKLCPWRPEDNPHFKPSKKHYHTNIVLQAFKKKECPAPPKAKEPCGWVAEEKEREAKKLNQTKPPPKKPTKSAISAEAAQYLNLNDLNQQNDLQTFLELVPKDKIPCPRPEGECEKRKKLEKQEKDKVIVGKEDDKPKKTTSSRLDSAMSHWLNLLQPSRQLLQPTFVSQWSPSQTTIMASDDTKEPCKKFPFKEIPYEFIKEQEVKVKPGGCKKRIKKKTIVDCPPETDSDQKSAMKAAPLKYFEMKRGVGMLLKDEGKGSKDPACPKLNVGICHAEVEPDVEDECAKKKKKPQICPTDLLPTKGRKKIPPKTATAIIPPPTQHIQGSQPHQQQTRRKSTSISRFYH